MHWGLDNNNYYKFILKVDEEVCRKTNGTASFNGPGQPRLRCQHSVNDWLNRHLSDRSCIHRENIFLQRDFKIS